MIKFDTGSWVGNNGITKHIICKSALPCKVGDLVIGAGLIILGVGYLAIQSFKHGALNFEQSEYEALDSLGLLHDVEEK